MAAPEGYQPDNMLGNVCGVIADRTGITAETVAHKLAEKLGNGDYGVAEDRVWDQIGPVLDWVQDALELEWAE